MCRSVRLADSLALLPPSPLWKVKGRQMKYEGLKLECVLMCQMAKYCETLSGGKL